jgi:hypothetical protein
LDSRIAHSGVCCSSRAAWSVVSPVRSTSRADGSLTDMRPVSPRPLRQYAPPEPRYVRGVLLLDMCVSGQNRLGTLMTDEQIPFTLAGTVVSWDLRDRVLYVGSNRLTVAPGVDTASLTPSQRVAVTGYRSKEPFGIWVVTEIRPHRPGF